MSVFEQYAAYYDLVYRDKDYAGEASFVLAVLGAHAPAARRLLELGCGTGRHAGEFAERGCAVHGIDRSAEMIAQATERAAALPATLERKLSFETGDACSFRSSARYDAVLALFHVLSYQTLDRDLEAVVATAAAALDAGGLFLFDCWYGPAVVNLEPEDRVLNLEDETTRVVRRAAPEWGAARHCVDVHYTIEIEDKRSGERSEITETHAMRYLFLPEIEALLHAAGFALLESGAWMTRAPLNDTTWNAYVAARLQREA